MGTTYCRKHLGEDGVLLIYKPLGPGKVDKPDRVRSLTGTTRGLKISSHEKTEQKTLIVKPHELELLCITWVLLRVYRLHACYDKKNKDTRVLTSIYRRVSHLITKLNVQKRQ